MTPLWPIGLSPGCFYRQSIFTVLEEIRASGFEPIEVCSFPKHFDYHHESEVRRAGQMTCTLGLRRFSFHAPFADRIDITSPDDAVREAAVAELITDCRAHALFGAENTVLHPWSEREGRPPQEEFLLRMRHAAVSRNCVAAPCCGNGLQPLWENMLPLLHFGKTSDIMYLLGEMCTCHVGPPGFLASLLLEEARCIVNSIRDPHVNRVLLRELHDSGFQGRTAVNANSTHDAAKLREMGASGAHAFRRCRAAAHGQLKKGLPAPHTTPRSP